MSEKTRRRKAFQSESNRLHSQMCAIKGDLDCAWSAFDHVTDPGVMDAYIYEISALQSRYNCAVRDLKALYEKG